MKRHKSWQEKLASSKGLPKVVKMTGKMKEKFGAGTMVVPAPKEVDEIMARVGKGKLITVNQIREALAQKHEATLACPMTTGIFAWIASHASEEAMAEGKKRVTPYWRTLKSGGELNPKYPGGVELQAKRLKEEGHVIEQGRVKFRIKNFEKSLIQL